MRNPGPVFNIRALFVERTVQRCDGTKQPMRFVAPLGHFPPQPDFNIFPTQQVSNENAVSCEQLTTNQINTTKHMKAVIIGLGLTVGTAAALARSATMLEATRMTT